jgi:hypothetical protein
MAWTRWSIAVGFLVAAVALVACKQQGGEEQTAALSAKEARAAARTLFATRCSACHGAEGKGDGPASAALSPMPRNYSDATWQGSIGDDQISKAIVFGGLAAGRSRLMPPNPDLRDRPEVVKALVAIIRGFGKK